MSQPNLVLVHGWGLGHSAWDGVWSALCARFRVHLFALPGYSTPGEHMNKQSSPACLGEPHEQTAFTPIPGRTPFDALSGASALRLAPPPLQGEGWGGDGGEMPAARVLADFFQTAQALAAALPENCLLCGWSLGAMLALQAAGLAPQRIRKLILVGATPSFTQRADWSHAQPPALLETFSDALAGDAATTLKRFITLFNQGDTQARLVGRSLVTQLLATPLPVTASLLTGLDWLREVDLRQQIASIDVPTQLIHGENDPLMPLAAAQWLAKTLPRAQLEVFSGAAHAPFLNDPDRFATLLGDNFHAPALD